MLIKIDKYGDNLIINIGFEEDNHGFNQPGNGRANYDDKNCLT